ncbi:MAG: hypothetical protein H7320_11675 [Ferruginibacter sp.]|nr:hypothetical protein [Ferruginibacter sp.]
MKKLLFISLLFSSIICNGQIIVNGNKIYNALPVLPPPLDTARIVVITGQSNANSHGQNLSAQFTSPIIRTKHWDTTAKLFTNYSSFGLTTTGLNTQTGGLQVSKYNDSIFCIKIVQGSLAISNWSDLKGSLKLALDSALIQSIRTLRVQGKYVKVLSTIWLQGEQDCNEGSSAAAYQAKLDSVITRYRKLDISMSNTQFVIVKLVEGSGAGGYITPASTLNNAYVNLSVNKTNVSLIRPEDVGAILDDGVHYTAPSYILIANAWNTLIK